MKEETIPLSDGPCAKEIEALNNMPPTRLP